MKVSIITATYNSAHSLAACLGSVASQTYKNIEHIVVDGQSTDDTLAIIQKFPTVSKVISEPDEGVYEAFNKGVQVATGDVIGILNSDDVFSHSEVVQQIISCFGQNASVNGIYGNLVFVNEMQQPVRLWMGRPYRKSLIKFGWMPAHPTVFLRRTIYDNFGAFDADYKISGDYDFLLRIMKQFPNRLFYLDDVMVKMKVGGLSTGTFKNLIRKSREDYKALRKNQVSFPLCVVVLKIIRKVPQYLRSNYRFNNMINSRQ